MIDIEQAYKIAQKSTDNRLRLIQCDEFDTFFGFVFSEHQLGEAFAGTYTTVDKKTGKVGAFSPQDDFDLFDNRKPVDINKLI